jgi:hypothetical protein
VEIDIAADHAKHQLCASQVGEPFSLPPDPHANVAACDMAFACSGGTVVSCGPPSVAVAQCIRGCVSEGQSFDTEGAGVSASAAAALLCNR